jgi:hypothetical protein
MESYPVDIDIDPEQVVRWLMVERQKTGTGLDIAAWRLNRVRPFEPGAEDRFGDEEREDLSDEVTVAQLMITPTHAGVGWSLVVSVEVERQAIVAGEDSADEREPVDLDTFYLDFIRPGRGTARVTAEANSTEAEAHLDQLLHAIETNAHVPGGRPSKAGKAA